MADERAPERESGGVELVIRIGLLVVTGLVVATVFGEDLRTLVASTVGRGAQPQASAAAQPR